MSLFLAKLLPHRILSEQARKPSGLIGRFLMANFFKKGNNDLNDLVAETLQLEPIDQVLEIGFGPGELICKMARKTVAGHIDGIDFSVSMLAKAQKKNAQAIAANSVTLQQGDCRTLPYAAATFDKVCAVNTLYFWKPPEHYLAEIKRVLKPGGRFVLGLRSGEQMDTLPLDKTIFTTYSLPEAVQLISKAGFVEAHYQEKAGIFLTSYCVVGKKSSH